MRSALRRLEPIMKDRTSSRIRVGIIGASPERGWAGIVLDLAEAVVLRDNVVEDNSGVGISVRPGGCGAAVIVGTEARRNGWAAGRGGIELHATSATRFEGNVLEDNAFGLHVPYASGETVRAWRDNWVNGRNVDGAIVPSDQAYWIGGRGCEDGLRVADRTFESTPGGRYRGALSTQGFVTAYDCGDVVVVRARVEGNGYGVLVWSARSLRVTDSEFVGNRLAYDRALSEGDDLVASGAVLAHGVGALLVARNRVADADTAFADRLSNGRVEANVVEDVAFGVRSVRSSVAIAGNTVARCVICVRVSSGGDEIARNDVSEGSYAGILLELSAPRLVENRVRGGAYGLSSRRRARRCSASRRPGRRSASTSRPPGRPSVAGACMATRTGSSRAAGPPRSYGTARASRTTASACTPRARE